MRRILTTAMIAFLPLAVDAQPLSSEQQHAIDESVTEWLAKTEAPSVSIAIASGNDVVYAKAFFSDNANAYLTPAVPADQKIGLAPLGSVRIFSRDDERERGGMHVLSWKIVTTKASLTAVEIVCPDGKLEQFQVSKDSDRS